MPQKTYMEIQEEIARLQREAEEVREAELAEVIERINKAIEVYGLRPEDLSFPRGGSGRAASASPRASGPSQRAARPAGRSGRAGAAKYRDDQGNTWGGRGPRPQWLRDALQAGKSLDDFRA
ncbi:H-NS histone family protein [Ramlibacter sp. AN1015]|uniref:H-NS histone family protein n=1 Tax=Ramlibacter sp. AN1015 TaxID=3133428 RepID=UPI0030C3DCE8